MRSMIWFWLIFLIATIDCTPLSDKDNQILEDPSSAINNSNDLRRELEQPGDNKSHHSLQEPNMTLPVVEKIRSVVLFKAKISQRINQSIVIPHFPGMKTKLLEIAVEKFKTCELSRSSSEVPEMEQSCLALVTAQMMSLINAFERNPTLHFK